MGISVKVNKASVRAALKQLENRISSVSQAVKDEVAATALAIDGDAKKSAPVDTGRLRASITPEFFDGGYRAKVSTNVEYAQFVEYGTSKQRAQPFLFPAAEAHKQAFLDNIKRILKGQSTRSHTSNPQVHTGKRGGQFYYNSQGKKVYKKRK